MFRQSRGCTGKREQEGILTGEHHMNTEYVHSSSQIIGQNLRCAPSCYSAFVTQKKNDLAPFKWSSHMSSPKTLGALFTLVLLAPYLQLSSSTALKVELPPDHCLQSLPSLSAICWASLVDDVICILSLQGPKVSWFKV